MKDTEQEIHIVDLRALLGRGRVKKSAFGKRCKIEAVYGRLLLVRGYKELSASSSHH